MVELSTRERLDALHKQIDPGFGISVDNARWLLALAEQGLAAIAMVQVIEGLPEGVAIYHHHRPAGGGE